MFEFQSQDKECFCFDNNISTNTSGLYSSINSKIRHRSDEKYQRLSHLQAIPAPPSKISLKKKRHVAYFQKPNFEKQPQLHKKNVIKNEAVFQDLYHSQPTNAIKWQAPKMKVERMSDEKNGVKHPITQIRKYYDLKFNYVQNPIKFQEPNGNEKSQKNYSMEKSKISLKKSKLSEQKQRKQQIFPFKNLESAVFQNKEIKQQSVDLQRRLVLKQIESIVDDYDLKSDIMSEVIGRGWQRNSRFLEMEDNVKTETILTKASNIKNSFSMNSHYNGGQSIMRWA